MIFFFLLPDIMLIAHMGFWSSNFYIMHIIASCHPTPAPNTSSRPLSSNSYITASPLLDFILLLQCSRHKRENESGPKEKYIKKLSKHEANLKEFLFFFKEILIKQLNTVLYANYFGIFHLLVSFTRTISTTITKIIYIGVMP